MKKGLTTPQMLVALDIGTTKICVLIGKKIGESLEVIGIGKAPSDGLAKGIVVDIARTVQSIKTAKKEAELMAGVKIESAVIGVSGSHIQSTISHGMVPVRRGQVRELDVMQAIAAARAVSIAQEQQVLHVLPQFYILDGQEKLKDPIGMHGLRLEVQVNIITGSVTCVQNLVHCCQLAGINVDDIVLEPLASAWAVLSDDEKQLGVALLDIGGGTSDFVIYTGGSLRYAFVVPIAGNHFTQDLAICLRTTLKDAERLKIEHGSVGIGAHKIEHITAQTMHGGEHRHIEQSHLIEILAARARELLCLIQNNLEQHALTDHIVAGLVLTGGGAELRGLDELAARTLDLPVRVGFPQPLSFYHDALASPQCATGYGLLTHASKKLGSPQLDTLNAPLISRVFWRMKSWVGDFF